MSNEYPQSALDPATFLDQSVDGASVRRPPLPAGAEVIGTIGEPKSRSWQGRADPSKSGIVVDIPIEIDLTPYPDLVNQQGGVTRLVITDGAMLDLTPGGAIDNSPGRNRKMRYYREATGLNNPKQSFTWRQLQGHQVKVKIKHRIADGEAYDEVDSISRA